MNRSDDPKFWNQPEQQQQGEEQEEEEASHTSFILV